MTKKPGPKACGERSGQYWIHVTATKKITNLQGRPRAVIDFRNWPAGSSDDWHFDVPMEPHGALKKALRAVLRKFSRIESAWLLTVGNRTAGPTSLITVVLVKGVDPEAVAQAWLTDPQAPPIAFDRAGHDVLSRFAEQFAAPFYVRDSAIPASLSTPELLQWLATIPDRPSFASFSELLAEAFPDAPAAALDWLVQTFRRRSTHAEAKRALREVLQKNAPFALLLRTFATEAIGGTSEMFGDVFGVIVRPVVQSTVGRIAKTAGLKLFGITNPASPVRSADVLQLEVGDEWLQPVVSLAARARTVFVICDRLTTGIETEFAILRHLEREDQTLIVLPTDELQQHYIGHQMAGQAAPESFDAARLRRKLVTFGTTATSAELESQAASRLRRGSRTNRMNVDDPKEV